MADVVVEEQGKHGARVLAFSDLSVALRSGITPSYASDGAFTTARGTVTTGDLYYNTSLGEFRFYTGSAFQGMGTDMPPGGVIDYLVSTAPSGYLPLKGETMGNAASGATHASSDYEALFNIIKNVTPNAGSEVFGDGDTVTLMDTRRRVVVGKADSGDASTLGGTGGTFNHTHTVASHTHGVGSHTHGVTITSGGPSISVDSVGGGVDSVATSAHTHSVSGNTASANGVTAAASPSTDSDNQAYIVMMKIVKV